MLKYLNRYWNLRLLGIPKAMLIILRVSYLSIYESLSSLFWRFNIKECAKGVKIQKGTQIRFPNNVSLKVGVKIGRYCNFDSEFVNSILEIGENTQINKSCSIDYTGDLYIGKNVLISENVILMSHDHGHDPHAFPKGIKKIIGDNVWIGSHSIILPKVKHIGNNSIIASGSIVTRDVHENAIVAGNPAKVILVK